MKQPYARQAQPDFPDLLTDIQAQALEAVLQRLVKINAAIQRLNSTIVETGLNLPTVRGHNIGAVFGEAERLQFNHELAYLKLRRVVDAPEQVAA